MGWLLKEVFLQDAACKDEDEEEKDDSDNSSEEEKDLEEDLEAEEKRRLQQAEFEKDKVLHYNVLMHFSSFPLVHKLPTLFTNLISCPFLSGASWKGGIGPWPPHFL